MSDRSRPEADPARPRRSRRSLCRAQGPGLCRFEALEPRLVLSSFEFTPDEVYMLALVNRARLDPFAEGVRLGIDIAADLTPGELARLVPQPPLALNAALTLTSRAHSLDLAVRSFFDHVNPDGLDPSQRAQAQGYAGVAGENIAAGQISVDAVHLAWLDSVGHRRNVLSLHEVFSDTFYYHDFGAGFAYTDIAPYYDYYTQLFGFDGPTPTTRILGVVYTDHDGDSFYSIGEGAGDIRVELFRVDDPHTLIASTTTGSAGYYHLDATAGDYRVVFTDLTTGYGVEGFVTVDAFNAVLDAQTAQFTQRTDDHADAGDFEHATWIAIDPDTGLGDALGTLEFQADTDLFRFTSPGVGVLTVTIASPAHAGASLTLLGPDGRPLAHAAIDDHGHGALAFGVIPGQAYYLLVAHADDAATLAPVEYTLEVEAPPASSLAHPGDPGRDPADPTLRAASDADDRIVTVRVGSQGRPVAIVQQGGDSWTEIDLLDTVGGAPAIARAEAFIDTATARAHLVVPTALGLLLYTEDEPGVWRVRNLSAESGVSTIADQLLILRDPDGRVTLTGLDADGRLIAYTQPSQAGHAWAFTNIAEDHLAFQGQDHPAFTGDLIAYSTRWGALHVAGLDEDGRLHSVWWAPGMAHWTASDLTEITGAPPYVGGLTVYLTEWDGINIAGVDALGNVQVTWWVPSFAGAWVVSNLTELFDAPALQPTTLAGYVTPWGGLNIAGFSEAGELHVYWWVPGFGGEWVVSTLEPEGLGDLEAPLAPALHAHTTPRGVLNLFTHDTTGEPIRLAWDPLADDRWFAERLRLV